jgi:Transmembrane domain of unknown function (DUF3566)
MTQSPHGGNAAPAGSATSTSWGATSTSSGSGHGSEQHWGAHAAGHQQFADAATHAVPLVQGTAAPRQAGFPAGHASSLGATSPPSLPTAPAQASTHSRNNTASRPVRRGPRRARLQLRHINPWTVLKFSCVLSIALFFVWLIVIGVLYGILDGAGVIHKINDAYTTVQGSDSKAPVTAGVVFGGAAIIGAVNIVLFVALSTVGSVIYNLCADLVGGIEITLSES